MKNSKVERTEAEYTDEPMEFTIIENFLPPLDQLVLEEKRARVTINLSATSVDYFKKEAKKHHTQYQKLIRYVLDRYASGLSQGKVFVSKEDKNGKRIAAGISGTAR